MNQVFVNNLFQFYSLQGRVQSNQEGELGECERKIVATPARGHKTQGRGKGYINYCSSCSIEVT